MHFLNAVLTPQGDLWRNITILCTRRDENRIGDAEQERAWKRQINKRHIFFRI